MKSYLTSRELIFRQTNSCDSSGCDFILEYGMRLNNVRYWEQNLKICNYSARVQL